MVVVWCGVNGRPVGNISGVSGTQTGVSSTRCLYLYLGQDRSAWCWGSGGLSWSVRGSVTSESGPVSFSSERGTSVLRVGRVMVSTRVDGSLPFLFPLLSVLRV